MAVKLIYQMFTEAAELDGAPRHPPRLNFGNRLRRSGRNWAAPPKETPPDLAVVTTVSCSGHGRQVSQDIGDTGHR
jgi:hypothetical protein